MHADIKTPRTLKFGKAIEEVIRLVENFGTLVLILEAVLSTYHDEHGNPDLRGDFEKGRGWYYGPGVVTYAAANRFLRILHQKCTSNSIVYLAEAFLSFKKDPSPHPADAFVIFNSFWNTHPESLRDGTEPILDIIRGILARLATKIQEEHDGGKRTLEGPGLVVQTPLVAHIALEVLLGGNFQAGDLLEDLVDRGLYTIALTYSCPSTINQLIANCLYLGHFSSFSFSRKSGINNDP